MLLNSFNLFLLAHQECEGFCFIYLKSVEDLFYTIFVQRITHVFVS